MMRCFVVSAFAQEQTAPPPTAPSAQAPEPLSADELEVLVARIALYPDELVALISAASLYPLQIVEAARYLDAYAKDKSLKPKESWDGSVVSLLNYPDVVKMMSDDLDWTQALGDALAYQQKDVLIAIQQLRDEAVAKNIIKSDDKMNGGRRQATISSSSRRARTRSTCRATSRQCSMSRATPRRRLPTIRIPIQAIGTRRRPFFAAAVTGVAMGRCGQLGRLGHMGRRLGRRRSSMLIATTASTTSTSTASSISRMSTGGTSTVRSSTSTGTSSPSSTGRTSRTGSRPIAANSIRNRAANIKRDRVQQTSPTGQRKPRIFVRARWKVSRAGLAATWQEPGPDGQRPAARPAAGRA